MARVIGQRYNVKTHGMTKTPEYGAWTHMIDRCTNPKSQQYNRYGGRGISVCPEWRTFDGFFADMGRRPSPLHSLEREDNDGNYESSNCRWATRQEQNRNRSPNNWVEIKGERMVVADAMRLLKVFPHGWYYHIRRGMTHQSVADYFAEKRL